jgi:hypothetical protein
LGEALAKRFGAFTSSLWVRERAVAGELVVRGNYNSVVTESSLDVESEVK